MTQFYTIIATDHDDPDVTHTTRILKRNNMIDAELSARLLRECGYRDVQIVCSVPQPSPNSYCTQVAQRDWPPRCQ
jgi:hypothetical protein